MHSQRYNVAVALYTDSGQFGQLQDSAPLVKFSDFVGIGYFGDDRQQVIAPIFDLRQSAERAWARVIKSRLLNVIFVEHAGKYEFVAYPVELKPDEINHVLYRSFSSLDSLYKFRSSYSGRAFIKFGWHDLIKVQKFDVLAQYAAIESVEFKKADDIMPHTLVDQIRKS